MPKDSNKELNMQLIIVIKYYKTLNLCMRLLHLYLYGLFISEFLNAL